MKKKLSFWNMKHLAVILLILGFHSVKATFVPVPIASGFTADVIANNKPGTTATFPTNTNPAQTVTLSFDSSTGTKYYLIAGNYLQHSLASPPSCALPVATSPPPPPTFIAQLNSLATPGLSFVLAGADTFNSLRLIGTASPKNTGTLVLSNTSHIGDVYILGAAATGSATATIVVNFTDNSNQTFTNILFEDYYNGASPAVQNIGRIGSASPWAPECPASNNPRLYQKKLTLAWSNYTKTIQSITVTRTTGSAVTSVLNIMAVSIDNQSCLPVQNLAVSNITMTGANFNWTASPQSGIQGYQVAVTTTATPPTTGLTLVPTNTFSVSGLNNGTNYWFHVRVKCSGTDSSLWSTLPFTTVTCPAPTAAQITISGITTVSANFTWRVLGAWNGWDYIISTSATPTGSGTFKAPLDTTHSVTGLFPGTVYYIHLRNKCPSPSNSLWVTKAFSTLPCPSAGTPTVSNNVPGQITINWPGTATPGVVDYQYGITSTPSPPSTWTSTTNTSATVTGLVPGANYYAWVRSNCSATNSNWISVLFFNPFPACYTPDTIMISDLNMHGARFKWPKSATVQFTQGYQYVVNTSPTPPASGPQITDTFITINNLLAGTNYYMHVRTHCGTTNYSPWRTLPFTTPTTCLLPLTSPNISNVTTSSAIITWQSYPSIVGYEHFISTSPTPPSIPGFPGTFNAYAPVGLNSGTTYYFHLRVRCNATSYSPWSTTQFATETVCDAPQVPVVTSIGATDVTINWNQVVGASSYEVSVDMDPNPPVSPNVGIPAFTNSFTSNLLVPSTLYYFHVRSFCGPNDISPWQTINFQTYSLSVGGINGDNFKVEVYPNPVKELLLVTIKGKTNGKSAQINLVDMTGKVVLTSVINGDKAEINTGYLPAGMYLLRYVDSEHTGVIRIEKL